MKIEKIQDSDNSDNSSNKTVIEAEKTEKFPETEKEKFPDNVASCPPIPGGQVYNINNPPGMESALKLNTSTGTEESTPPQSSSRKSKYEYGTQVFQEKDCTCPYCYVRKSSKNEMSFIVNAANMVRQTTNAKCSMSRPAANSAGVAGCPTPMVNIKIKAKKNQEEYLATLRALPDTGASVDCIEENFAKKHNLVIQLDFSSMIKLISAEGKTMKVIGTTKLRLMAPGGGWTTTVALVCPKLSHQFLM